MLASLEEHLDRGDLRAALDETSAELRSNPQDSSLRIALFEFLLFAGDLERARAQLDVLAGESMEMAYAAEPLKTLLAGEERRRAVFAGEAEPEFVRERPPWADARLALLRARGPGEAIASTELERLDAGRPRGRFELDGQPCDDLRDGDDLLAPVLEAHLAGRYVWIGWDELRSLSSVPPRTLRDAYWCPVELELVGSPRLAAHVPALYIDSHRSSDPRVQLGQATDWEKRGGLVRGLGRRVLIAGDEARDFLSIRRLVGAGAGVDPPATRGSLAP